MRIVQLDLIRCLAVLLVLGRHMTPCPRETSYLIWALTSVWERGGWIGVDLFFVLSGFLVSGLLFREYKSREAVNATHFLIRRGFKIYPAFWAMLATTVAISVWFEGALSKRGLIGEVFFVQNYFGALWNHTWSLAVEEHFYLLLALLTVWLCRRQSKLENPFALLPTVFVVVAIVCFFLRLHTAVTLPYNHRTHLFATHIRIDSLLFGVLISYYWHFKELSDRTRLSRLAPFLFVVGAIMLAPAFIFPLERTKWISVLGLTTFYIGSGALLLGMLYIDIPDSYLVRCLAGIGTFSYSIYLWHMPVHEWGIRIARKLAGAPLNWFAYAGIYLAGAIVVGIVASKIVEYPVLRVRDRLYPSQSAQGVSGYFPSHREFTAAART